MRLTSASRATARTIVGPPQYVSAGSNVARTVPVSPASAGWRSSRSPSARASPAVRITRGGCAIIASSGRRSACRMPCDAAKLVKPVRRIRSETSVVPPGTIPPCSHSTAGIGGAPTGGAASASAVSICRTIASPRSECPAQRAIWRTWARLAGTLPAIPNVSTRSPSRAKALRVSGGRKLPAITTSGWSASTSSAVPPVAGRLRATAKSIDVARGSWL